MSDLRISNAPKERSRAGRSRENAPNLAGVNSVLALDTKILMAVSSWAKHVHEKLIPGSFPAHADVPVLNNAEFELLNRRRRVLRRGGPPVSVLDLHR